MLKEFFGDGEEEALRSAEKRTGLTRDKLKIRRLADVFGKSLQKQKVCLLVEYDPVVATRECSRTQGGTAVPKDQVSEAILREVFGELKIGINIDVQEKQDAKIFVVHFQEDIGKKIRRNELVDLRSALQHLVNKVESKSNGDRERPILIDIGGSMEGRANQLSEIAGELEEKAKTLKKGINIHHMDSQDRRIVHTALLDHPAVRTTSSGEDKYRVIRVEPTERGG